MPRTLALRAMATAALVGLVGWAPPRDQMTLQPESRLWVEGTSTMRSWKCDAPGTELTVEAGPAAVRGVLAAEHAVKAVHLVVTTARMDCHNGTMNDHMKKALKAAHFPTIAFTLASYDLATATDTVHAVLNGELSLGGVQKPITLTTVATAGPDGALRVVGTYELNMKEYGLTPPSLMFGTMKVGALVKVRFDLLLKS